MLERLVNRSEIIEDVLIADNFISRFKGYMLQKEPKHRAILIKPCNSIHTFFMKFDIDVLFLNGNREVIKKLVALEPRKIIMPIKEAKMVLEGEAGIFENIEIGDRICFDRWGVDI